MFFLSPPLFREVSKVLLNLGEITSAPAVTVTTVLTLLVFIGPTVEVMNMNGSHSGHYFFRDNTFSLRCLRTSIKNSIALFLRLPPSKTLKTHCPSTYLKRKTTHNREAFRATVRLRSLRRGREEGDGSSLLPFRMRPAGGAAG